jgi:O-antigen ligase
MMPPPRARTPRAPPAGLDGSWPAAVTLASTFVGAAAIIGASLLLPRLGPNIAPADAFLAGAILLGLRDLRGADPSPGRGLGRAIAPWVCVITAGSIIALTTVGVTSPALISLTQSTYAITILVAAYALFSAARVDRRRLVWATGAAIAVVTAGLVAVWVPGTRPAGSFYHPNYAGHFLAMATIVWWRGADLRTWLRVAIAAVGVAGVLLTASFGALLMLTAAALPGAAERVRRRPWTVPAMAAVLSVVVLGGAGPTLTATITGLAASPTLNAERFERSQEGRFDLWDDAIGTTREHPLGIGPESFRTQPQLRGSGTVGQGREPHNVYLAFLVERGALGLFGLIGLGVALWRYAPPGGIAHALLLAIMVSNLVRETLHYRHMWLFLALAFALDRARRGSREAAHAA